MIGAVLVHDRETLGALLRRPGLGDVDDAAVEIAVFAGDPLIDLVGDDVRDTSPVLRGRGVGKAGQLLFGIDVPQPELDPEAAVALRLHRPRHQRLGVDLAPVAKARPFARRDSLDEAARIERPEQTGAFEVGRHHLGHVAAGLRLIAAAAGEGRDRDRHRLDLAAGDVEAQLGRCRESRQQQHDERNGRPRNRPDGAGSAHKMSFGLKATWRSFQISYLSAGSLSGVHCGLKKVRRALSAAAR